MQDQLQAVVDEFASALARVHELAHAVPDRAWRQRPAEGRWSAGECVAHLNLTSRAFIPIVRDAIVAARRIPGPPPPRYRRDFFGWLLWKTSGPPARLRVKTTAPFVPVAGGGGDGRADTLVAEFDSLQADQIACVRDAEGLRIDRVKVTSPFDARVKYNLYACLTILPRHQHRHLRQAEQALAALEQV
jgi:hypothetical protein